MKKYRIVTIDRDIFEADRNTTEFLENYVAFVTPEGRIIIPWGQIKSIQEILA